MEGHRAQVLVLDEGSARSAPGKQPTLAGLAPHQAHPAPAAPPALEAGSKGMVNLTYDPMLNCYYDPSTQQYYEV